VTHRPTGKAAAEAQVAALLDARSEQSGEERSRLQVRAGGGGGGGNHRGPITATRASLP
jgi:hypothetical protein